MTNKETGPGWQRVSHRNRVDRLHDDNKIRRSGMNVGTVTYSSRAGWMTDKFSAPMVHF